MKHNKKTAERTETVKIINLVDYRKDSIVSRTLIDGESGNVTFFAFDERQGLSEHVAPYEALVYILDGEAQVAISGKTYDLKEGETILIPANKPHALKATRKFKMMLTMIKT